MTARIDYKISSSNPSTELPHITPQTLLAMPKRGRTILFLSEWANADSDDFRRLARLYPEFHIPISPSPTKADFPIFEEWTRMLKNAWREAELVQKNLGLAWLLSGAVYVAKGNHAQWAYPVTGALIEALRITERLKVCSNPDCPAPLFIAKRPRQQRQCSPECAQWAQRQAKLAWWNEYGKRARKEREFLAKRRPAGKRVSRRKKSSRREKRK